MGLFDAKLFNSEVFQQYMDRIPNTKLNELVKSRAIVQRQDLINSDNDGFFVGLVPGVEPTKKGVV